METDNRSLAIGNRGYTLPNLKIVKAARMVGGDDARLINEQALRAAGKIREKATLTSYDLFMVSVLSLIVGIALGYAWHFMQG